MKSNIRLHSFLVVKFSPLHKGERGLAIPPWYHKLLYDTIKHFFLPLLKGEQKNKLHRCQYKRMRGHVLIIKIPNQ